MCAEEWARFCGRHACADAIAKYVRSKKYLLKKTFRMSRDKWSSEPNLHDKVEKDKNVGNWIQRHLSFKKKGARGGASSSASAQQADTTPKMSEPLVEAARCASSPLLATTVQTPPESPQVRLAMPRL